jgi:hypothetical protein
MTCLEWITGCLVVLAALSGGVSSSKIVDANFPTVARSENRNVSTPTANPPIRNSTDLTEDRNQLPSTRHCSTLGANQFEWPWPNVPFAAIGCSQ